MNKWYFFILIILLGSCSGKLDKNEFIEWVEDYGNGLHKTKEVGDFNFDVQYIPTAYKVFQDLKGKKLKKEEFERELNAVSGMQYFKLRLSIKDKTKDLIQFGTYSTPQRQEKIYYFSYTFQNDIFIEQDGKKIPCILYHFERSFDLKNSRTFMLGFEDSSLEKGNASLVIDSDILGTGPVKLKFNKDKIPEIDI